MVWFSTALVGGAAVLATRPEKARLISGDLALPLIALALALAFGIDRLHQPIPENPKIRMVLVQPSIPQTLIWNPGEATNRFQRLLALTELALRTHPDVVVWPEAAVPNLLRYDPWILGAVTNLATRHHVWMIIGADDAEPKAQADAPDAADYFNASFLVDPQGQLRARYCKRQLVVFGEYLPLQPWLFFLKWFTPVRDGFTAGQQPANFIIDKPECVCSVLICFEDTFAGLARQSARLGLDFLVNLTNNGWFGESAAQWQHAANAIFRAIENDCPVVRCSNNGLTCWVDRWGQMHQVFFDDSNDIYRAGFKLVNIPLRGKASPQPRTFYQRYGDWLGWSCVVVLFGVVIARWPWGRPRGGGLD
jgi:apolipoprotein N-acyltransferase